MVMEIKALVARRGKIEIRTETEEIGIETGAEVVVVVGGIKIDGIQVEEKEAEAGAAVDEKETESAAERERRMIAAEIKQGTETGTVVERGKAIEKGNEKETEETGEIKIETEDIEIDRGIEIADEYIRLPPHLLKSCVGRVPMCCYLVYGTARIIRQGES